MNAHSPPVLFGAFDRHNFGDLLFPHLLGTLLPARGFAFAGLVARDLRALGGHQVSALGGPPRPAGLIHAGGELLTCTAWQAAVMLLDPAAAAAAISRYGDDPAAAAAWATRQLGTARTMPYVVGRDALALCGKLIFNAVGGVEWDVLSAAERGEVKAALRQADWLSVRDHVTQAALRAEGIAAPLCPAPAVMVEQMLRRGDSPAPAAGRSERRFGRFPAGLSGVPVQRGFCRRCQPGCAGAGPRRWLPRRAWAWRCSAPARRRGTTIRRWLENCCAGCRPVRRGCLHRCIYGTSAPSSPPAAGW